MNEKDQKLQRILELAKIADALTATQAKEYVQLLVTLTNKQKEALVKEFQSFADTVSQETFQRIKEGLDVISEKHKDAMLEVRQLSNKQKKEHEARIIELQTLLDEIKSIEVRDGYTPEKGVDYFTESEIKELETSILAKIPEIPELQGEDFVDKVNSLEITPDKQIDASHIKNLKINGNVYGGARNLYTLADVSIQNPTNSQVLKYNSTTKLWENGVGGGGGGSGTVTSVDMTVPTGLTVSGNPITTSGTLAVALDTGYVIPLQSTLDGFVPYTGATGDVDLGGYGLLADTVTIGGNGIYTSTPELAIDVNNRRLVGSNGEVAGFASAGSFTLYNPSGVTEGVILDTSTVSGGMFTQTLQSANGTIALLSDITGGLTWTEVTGTTQAASPDNGYIANNASQVDITLPTTIAVGQIIEVTGKGAGGWRISQNASQVIHFGSVDSATGTGGYIESTATYDSVRLLCIVSDLEFVVLSSVGNITVV